ncbi:MAG: hypothetical protein V1755_05740 [Chloroflexota bacterium]
MRDKARIDDILKRLKTAWEQSPDLRLGQLLTASVSKTPLFYIEDDPLIDSVESLLKTGRVKDV